MHAPGKENVGGDNETILREMKRERVETEGLADCISSYPLLSLSCCNPSYEMHCTFVIGVHIELCNGTPCAQEDSFQLRRSGK